MSLNPHRGFSTDEISDAVKKSIAFGESVAFSRDDDGFLWVEWRSIIDEGPYEFGAYIPGQVEKEIIWTS